MVPRYHFVKATSFFGFTLNRNGNDDENVVKLEGVEKIDFQALLKLMYPLYVYVEQSFRYI